MTTRSTAGRLVLALSLVLGAACSGRGCDGCTCTGAHDTASPRRAAAESSGARDPTAEEEPEAEQTEETPRATATTGSGGGTTAPAPPAEQSDEPSGGAVALGDRPTSAQVGAVLRGLREQTAACSRGVRTSVVLEVTIAGADGRVRSTRVIGPSAGTPEADCVEALVRRAEFPTFARAEMTVAYAYGLPGEAGSTEPSGAVDGGTIIGAEDGGEPDAGETSPVGP